MVPSAAHAATVPSGWTLITSKSVYPLSSKYISIFSHSNYRYTYPRLDWNGDSYGALVTSRAEPGLTTDKFAVTVSSGTFLFRNVANNRYVCAEISHLTYPGVLRARTSVDAPGPWEKFRLYYSSSQVAWALMSTANNKWVTAHTEYASPLVGLMVADSNTLGTKQKFGFTGWTA
ncbi:hypothetical protein GCM10009687_41140 [Asanoa iriomotensis]|uniref:Uncharacterized protein n=1 Tax=Asanoa iriomotensis TaxID=234613 RepID=A0ABQ4C0B8_9ACTN|nr:hypothetical protein Air01nite_18450 [Asanoa iriomotensis]